MPDPGDFSRHPEAPLFALLDRLGLSVKTHHHEKVMTVAESVRIKAAIPGAHTKNLFMKDKSGRLVLVSAWGESELPLNQLHRVLGVQRLSFTDAETLWRALGVTPGSVTGFALINDDPPQVRFVLDQALLRFDIINFHPLRNDMSTAISREDFLAFCKATGHPPTIVDFTALKPAEHD